MQICENLAKLSRNSKKKFGQKLEEQLETIENSPYIYQKIIHSDNLEIRKVKIKKYILFYKIKEDRVSILRILPEKFDYFNHLEKYKILIQK